MVSTEPTGWMTDECRVLAVDALKLLREEVEGRDGQWASMVSGWSGGGDWGKDDPCGELLRLPELLHTASRLCSFDSAVDADQSNGGFDEACWIVWLKESFLLTCVTVDRKETVVGCCD